MSYRLIDSNAIAEKYPEVNDIPCVFADLPNGLDGSFIDVQPVVHGKWVKAKRRGVVVYHEAYAECSCCHDEPVFLGWKMKYCPNCGARMEE